MVLVDDSAGVRVVETRVAVWDVTQDAQWAVDPAPELEIPRSGDVLDQLYPIDGAFRLSDGRIVAGSGRTRVLVWFSPEGEYLFERGGVGGGPDEFDSPFHQLILVPPDTVAVVRSGGRISLFSGEGNRVEVRVLTQAQEAQGARLSDLVRLGPDWIGSFTEGEPEAVEKERYSGYHRSENALARLPGDAAGIDTIGVVRSGFVASNEESRARSQFLVLSPSTVFAVRDEEIFVGSGEGHEIMILSGDGQPRQLLRWAGEDLTLGPADEEAWRQDFVQYSVRRRTDRSPAPEWYEDVAAGFQFSPTKPAYTHILLDPHGNVWLRHSTFRTGPEEYSVLAADGRMLGEVSIPEGLRVTQVGNDFVLGVAEDDLGLNYVRMHPLIKPDEAKPSAPQ